ncbi:MAG: hypothetical protein SAJ12_01490 [Jaaginema sp. PMC 1079.18]|nr:hypothetical protein [Jaaginema sp. PMC 1080.18]MEC4849658.1 hypothetical protein [Jaaginema sp. PMC 1079.18]MEC4866082.1 hypothetical protein [Jaaginema sp. PMC 1078.18]
MNYLIAVLSDRPQAEAAYSSLKNNNLAVDDITLLGEGYQSADDFGLIHPNTAAQTRSRLLSYWLIPFGFAAGYLFNTLTEIQIIADTSPIFNHIIGGVFGAVAGALGALIMGRVVGWTVGSGDALAYRNRLNAGKYLIVAQGSKAVLDKATNILKQYNPENIQGYTAPTEA